jgi:hypothetical protein
MRVQRNPSIATLLAIICSCLAGCSGHEVTTAEEWCESLSGVDLMEKNAPFWAVMPSLSFNGDAIRDDFTNAINSAAMNSVQGRAEKMAWRSGIELHIVNPASLNEIEPEVVIEQWRDGIENFNAAHQGQDVCVMGSVVTLFDRVHIHTWRWDGLRFNVVGEKVTTIETNRKRLVRHPI